MVSLKVILVCVTVIALFVDTYADSTGTTTAEIHTTEPPQQRRRRVKKERAGLIKDIVGGAQGVLNGAIDFGKGIFDGSGLIGALFNDAGDLAQGLINGTANVLYIANDEAGNFARQAKDTGKSFFTDTKEKSS